MEIEYKGRLFGDVLRDIIYTTSDNSYTFVRETGITNVMLTNFMKHNKYPGIRSLRRIASVLPEEERNAFILYFKNPSVKKDSIIKLKESGMTNPYSYAQYDKSVPLTSRYEETDPETLKGLQLIGLFKYLSPEEKENFKKVITDYIIERNQAMNNSLTNIKRSNPQLPEKKHFSKEESPAKKCQGLI